MKFNKTVIRNTEDILPSKSIICNRYDVKTGELLPETASYVLELIENSPQDDIGNSQFFVDKAHNLKEFVDVEEIDEDQISANEVKEENYPRYKPDYSRVSIEFKLSNSGNSPKAIDMLSQEDFNLITLIRHNELRSFHGCPPLQLNQDLARDCEEFARFLAIKRRLVHSNGNYGENLAMQLCPLRSNGKFPTDIWYQEILDHDFKNNAYADKSGHFSQVIWKSSKYAGFGYAVDAESMNVWVVGRYLPSGNIRNYYVENVPLPLNGRIELPK